MAIECQRRGWHWRADASLFLLVLCPIEWKTSSRRCQSASNRSGGWMRNPHKGCCAGTSRVGVSNFSSSLNALGFDCSGHFQLRIIRRVFFCRLFDEQQLNNGEWRVCGGEPLLSVRRIPFISNLCHTPSLSLTDAVNAIETAHLGGGLALL